MRIFEVKGHRLLIWIFIVLLIGQWGCIPPLKVKGPPTLAEQDRSKLGTIGLVAARFPPEAHLKGTMSEKDASARAGAARGILNCIGGGAELGGAGGFMLGILASPLCALVGGAYGASKGETTETVEETESILNRAVVDLNIQEAMRDRVFQIAQQESRYPLVLLTEQAPSARDAVVGGGSSARQETDTTLKVCVPGFGLEGGEINSPVQLFVIAHARIVKVSNGEELFLLYRIPNVENKSP